MSNRNKETSGSSERKVSSKDRFNKSLDRANITNPKTRAGLMKRWRSAKFKEETDILKKKLATRDLDQS